MIKTFDLAEQCFTYFRDSFDCLYGEGAEDGKMLTIGLHGRLIGRPGRIAALERFIDHVLAHDEVWICKRIEIARHWIERHPARP